VKLGLTCFAALLVACAPALTALDLTDAECQVLEEQTGSPVVTVVCDVIDATDKVIHVFEFSDTRQRAEAFVAMHPVKPGHPSPMAQVQR
jgi:hypothetical protein